MNSYPFVFVWLLDDDGGTGDAPTYCVAEFPDAAQVSDFAKAQKVDGVMYAVNWRRYIVWEEED